MLDKKLKHIYLWIIKLVLLNILILSTSPKQILADDFVVNDRPAAAPWMQIVDPEFDNRGYRAIWQDNNNNLWIADINPETGELIPYNGKGQMLVEAIAPVDARNANGPEWVYGHSGTSIVFTTKDSEGRYRLRAINETAPDQWDVIILENDASRYLAIATNNSGTIGPARVAYFYSDVEN